jgi:hypothetical protein
MATIEDQHLLVSYLVMVPIQWWGTIIYTDQKGGHLLLEAYLCFTEVNVIEDIAVFDFIDHLLG